MAGGVGKHKLLSVGPTEPWSVREKLCLASSVMRSGDQNWVSVSRAIKPFSEAGRPPDWFSQKHCASQYSELLETTEAPKRKRGEKGEVVETVEDVIVRRLTAERIEELKRLLKDTQERYRKLKKETEMIQTGQLDSRLDEFWDEIAQKVKQDEEEAELKRKATDAAYQARQAVKNTPKRLPSVTMRSTVGVSSPGVEFTSADTPQPTPEEPCATPATPVGQAFVPMPEAPRPADVNSGPFLEDSPQKKLLSQQDAPPPPSPLLSELLKKGSLLSSGARLVGDGETSSNLSSGAQRAEPLLGTTVPASQTSNGAPLLSHLLELGSTTQTTALAELSSTVPAAPALPASDNPPAGDTAGLELGPTLIPPPEDEKVEELEEATSFMEEELDLETVGDIIAIIENKEDDTSEPLDDATVEAVLCLCEEAAAAHALAGPWDSDAFKTADSTPLPPAPVSPAVNETTTTSSVTEPSPPGGGVMVEAEPHASSVVSDPAVPVTDSTPNSSLPVDSSRTETQEGKSSGETPTVAGDSSPGLKCKSEEQWPQADAELAESEDSSGSGKDSKQQEVKEEDGGSDVDEGSIPEVKEQDGEQDGPEGEPEPEGEAEGDGEAAYLSELEPVASESEDGYSLNASSLNRYNNTDSIPSSPASSQFSMSSEDQEALQAQKIWKKAIMLVWRAAANHRYASVFLQPVSDDIAPGYHSIVYRPMDLSVIKKNIESGVIRTTAEFQRDIMLMFQNAVMYNSSDHDVYHMALEMQRDVLEQIQQFLATQLIMQTSESGISAKSLRGRESTRRQDSSDKDTVPMASPAFLLSLFDGGTRGRRSAIEADMKMKK